MTRLAPALLLTLLLALPAQARPLCTIVMNMTAGGAPHATGECDTRVTPASTFKIALALMAFDAGVLQDAQTPALAYRNSYPDWGGENWRQTTDPARWMHYSVVWYSRQITPQLGLPALTRYARTFAYGNADFSGDYAQNNGLERAWMTSSLKISPREQVTFLSRLLRDDLPVSPHALARTKEIITTSDSRDGWRVWGKTGAAYPRDDTGRFDYARGWGWFVGWARRGDTTLVFAHLIQDDRRHAVSPGLRAKNAVLHNVSRIAAEVLE